jgi:hypothetical protein
VEGKVVIDLEDVRKLEGSELESDEPTNSIPTENEESTLRWGAKNIPLLLLLLGLGALLEHFMTAKR